MNDNYLSGYELDLQFKQYNIDVGLGNYSIANFLDYIDANLLFSDVAIKEKDIHFYNATNTTETKQLIVNALNKLREIIGGGK